jgi:hypothetical protein
MKTARIAIIALITCLAALTAVAQETPSGKKLAEDFWKALEEKRFVAAESKLNSLKRREPNFDASKMDKALADAKNQKDQTRAENRAKLLSNINASSALNDLFSARVIQADSSDTADSIKEEIEKYSKMADEVIAADRNELARDLERTLESLARDLGNDAPTNAKLVKSVNEATESKNAESAYYELLLRQSYWDTARRIFPNETPIAKAYDAITSQINALGTAEQRAAKAERNMNAKIDAERLPKAVVRDAALEKALQNAFVARAAASNWQYAFIKAVVISDDYGLTRHSITGIILSRYRIGAIAFKDKDGKCRQGRFRIDQNYVGGSFSGTWRGDFADFTHEMRCENVNK